MTEVRDLDLEPGDILLLQIKGWVGRAVWLMQLINRDASRWTHVGVVLPNDRLFEAQPGGAVISDLSDYADRPGAVVRLRQRGGSELVPLVLDADQRTRICQRATDLLGVGYNWGTYLYLALYRFGIRTNWIRWHVQNSERVICSQAADLIYTDCGVHLFTDGRMPYDVTPGDLSKLAAG